MTKWLLAFLLAFVGMAGSAVAQEERWTRINSVTVGPSATQALVDVSGWAQGCKGIRIAVRDANVAIEHISIVYSTGRVHAESLKPPVRVAPGSQSRVFAPTSDPRQVNLVTIRFQRLDRSARAVTFEVWGLQPAASIGGPPATAQRREFKFEQRERSAAPPPVARRMETPPPTSVEPRSQDPVGGSAPRSRGFQLPAPTARAPESAAPAAPPPPPSATPGTSGSAQPKAASRSLAPGAPDPNKPYTEVDIFFGTDRKRDKDRVKFERAVAAFGSGSSGQLTLGKAVVTIPEKREAGSIPRPEWDFIVARYAFRNEDPARDFTVLGVDVMDRQTFLTEARAKIASSKQFRGQAFVFVHGFAVQFDDALFRAAQIAHDLKFDGAPFVYSWPANGGITGYILDRGRARDARNMLREFVNLVGKETGASEVHLIAHSMGADPLLEVLRDISFQEQQLISQGAKPRFGEIILAAPDVTRESFEQIADQIKGLRRGMTLYASSNDRALTVSGWTRLGDPPAGYVPNEGPVVVPGIVDTLDVSSLDTSFFQLNHSTFADRAPLLGDMARLISSGLRPPSAREKQFEIVQGKTGQYWRYNKQ